MSEMPGLDRPNIDRIVWEDALTEKERIKKLIETMDSIIDDIRSGPCGPYLLGLFEDYERLKKGVGKTIRYEEGKPLPIGEPDIIE